HDRRFGEVDDRRREDAAELAERADGEGRTGQLLARRAAGADRLGETLDLARQLEDRLLVGVAHDADGETLRALGRDADVVALLADDLLLFLVERAIQRRPLAQARDRRADDER